MGNSRLKGISRAVIVGVALVTAGCAAPPAVQPPASEPAQVAQTSNPTQSAQASGPVRTAQGMPLGFVGPSAVPESTRQAIDNFTESLPEGVSWSAAPIHLGSDGEDAAIEDSVPEVAIAEYWSCTWMGDYLGAVDAGNRSRAEHAMSQLDKYPSLPAIIANHANPEVFTSSVLQPAKTGDTRMLREVFKTCRSLSVSADGTPTLTKMIAMSPASAG